MQQYIGIHIFNGASSLTTRVRCSPESELTDDHRGPLSSPMDRLKYPNTEKAREARCDSYLRDNYTKQWPNPRQDL